MKQDTKKADDLGVETSHLVSAPFRVVYADYGGYDCMTSSYDVYDANGKIVCELDSARFGQDTCPENRECPEAKAMAEHVAEALNFFHANKWRYIIMAQRVEIFSDEFDSETHKKMKETVRRVKALDDRDLWLYLKDLAYKSNRHFDFREVPVDLCTHFVVEHFKSKNIQL